MSLPLRRVRRTRRTGHRDRVLFITPDGDWSIEQYSSLLASVRARASLLLVSPSSRERLLSNLRSRQQAKAVIISEEVLTVSPNDALWSTIINGYVRRRGGIVVVIGRKALFEQPMYAHRLFGDAILSWRVGSREQRMTRLDPTHWGRGKDASVMARLPDTYDEETVLVRNVPRTAAWYWRQDDVDAWTRFTEGLIPTHGEYIPYSRRHLLETPVAMTRVGQGEIAYVGGGNAPEENTTAPTQFARVVVAMCRLGPEVTDGA